MKRCDRVLATVSALLFIGCIANTPRALAASGGSGNSNGGHNHCGPGSYKHGRCEEVPASGKFLIHVPATTVVLQGTGSPKFKPQYLDVARVSAQHELPGEQSFRIFAQSGYPHLTLIRPGGMYQYVPATDTWTRISYISGTGLFGVTYGTVTGTRIKP